MREAKVTDSLNTLRDAGVAIDKIIDVGIQHHTIPLIKLFPDVHHYLFEPVAEYYPHIRKNYEKIQFDLVEAAVTDFDGELYLHTEKKTRGDEISHSYITQNKTPVSRTVRALTLDTYFAEKRTDGLYLLKIDVEGPAVPTAILRGAKSVLRDTAVVMIEMTVDKFMERAIILHQAGFDLWDLCDLCYYGDCLWQADALFVRRDLKEANLALRPMHNRPFQKELWQSGF